jgi:hypothetical protein
MHRRCANLKRPSPGLTAGLSRGGRGEDPHAAGLSGSCTSSVPGEVDAEGGG